MTTFLDLSNLKAFADNKINMRIMKNIFFLITKCFQSLLSQGHKKSGLCGKELNQSVRFEFGQVQKLVVLDGVKKLLETSIFHFSYNVFKRLLFQGGKPEFVNPFPNNSWLRQT